MQHDRKLLLRFIKYRQCWEEMCGLGICRRACVEHAASLLNISAAYEDNQCGQCILEPSLIVEQL
jgi:hypothetical protein